MLKPVSIIIPIAPDETKLESLQSGLNNVDAEIITTSKGTRAKSLNAGATKAQRQFLWFLHADSHISEHNLDMLEYSLRKKPDALHYFSLAFDTRGLTFLNAWGANIRSQLFGTPFGDQGFCISKQLFEEIRGYPEDVLYGEDLMFVWRARQAGIKLNHIPSKLITSSRKYKIHGWLKLTILYQLRWIALSLPEACKLICKKI